MKNLQEMSLQEMREVEGGNFWHLLGLIVIGILSVVIVDNNGGL